MPAPSRRRRVEPQAEESFLRRPHGKLACARHPGGPMDAPREPQAVEHADGEIEEPENSTVDDWFGQNVERDAEVADRAAAEADSPEEAERIFDAEAEGQETYDEGHP